MSDAPRLKLIQCGAGGMGKAWWNGITNNAPDFELVAMVDVVESVLHEACDQLGLPSARRFTSLASALDSVEADAVLTVTPPPVHVEHAKLAFARGLHLLTEKPISHDLPAAKQMVELAHRAGRQLVVAQNYRYTAPMQRLRSILAEKPVGELGHGHIDFFIPADFTGTFRQSMEYPLLIDMAIHHIDLIRAITGRNITRVTAQTFKPSWSWFEHHPGLNMILELEGGLPFTYRGDWTARGRSTSWNGTWRLQCADGSIHCENDQVTVARCEKWNKNPTSEPIKIPPIELNGQAMLLRGFARAIRTETPAETSGLDNLWSFAAVMAGMISTRERGRAVDVGGLLR